MKSKRNSFLTSTALQATIVISLFVSHVASAADQTWTGTTDANWATTTNWSGAVLPGAADNAVFAAASTGNLTAIALGANQTVKGVTVISPAGPVTITTGSVLTLVSGGINMSSATQDFTSVAGITIQSAMQSWNVAAGRTLSTPVPIRNTATNSDLIGGHIVASTTGTIKMGTAASATILDGGNNPFVTLGSSDWAATDATGTVIAATYTPFNASLGATFINNADVTGSFTQTGNGGAQSIRFADTVTAHTVTMATGTTTFTGRGILVTPTSVGGTITGGNLRPNRVSIVGASISIIQNSTIGDLVIGSSISNASSSTPVSIIKGGVGKVIFTGGNGQTGRVFIHEGTLQYGNGGTGGTGSWTGTVFNNSSLVINHGDATGFTFGNIIAGTGSLTQSGSTKLTLSGVNTYTGATNVNSGTLAFNAATDLGTGGAINLNGGGLLYGASHTTDISGRAVSIGAGGGTIDTGANNVTFANSIGAGGTGSLTKLGAGSLTLSAGGSYSGNTIIGAGALVANGAMPGGALVNGGTLGGAGTFTGAVTVASAAGIAPGSGGIGTLTTGALTLGSGSNLDYDITNTTTLDRITVNGALTINGGQLNINGGTANFTANGVYNLIGGYTGSIGGAGVSALTVNTINKDTVNKTYTFGQNAGFVTLTVANSGSLVNYWNINGNSNWNAAGSWTPGIPNGASANAFFGGGGTTITAPRTVTVDGSFTVGTLGFNNPTNAFTLAAGTGANITLNNGAGTAFVNDTAGNHLIQAPLTLTTSGASFSVVTLGDTLTVEGVVSGNGPLTKIGNGTLALSGVNTYTGTTLISAGTVAVNSVSSLGDATFLTTIGAATLRATANITTPRNFNITDVASTISVDATKIYSISGVIGAGAGTLNKAGTGTLVLTGANTYTGGTVVSAGTLNVIDGALGTAPAAPATNLTLNGGTTLQAGAATVTLVANRSVVLNGGTANIDSNGNNLTIAGNISGSGLLKKIGAGNLTLTSAANSGTASGGTTIDAGTVFVASQANLPSGTLTLNGTAGITASAAANFSPVVNGTNFITGTATAILGLGNLSGNGTLTFGGPFVNDYTGTFTAFTGTLIASGGGSRWNGSTGGTNLSLDLVNTGTSVRNTATGITIGALAGSATSTLSGSGGGATQAVTYTIGGKTVDGLGVIPVDSTFNGTITNGVANTNITKVGGSTLTLTGTNTYSGVTTVNAGILHIAGSLTATSALNVYLGEAVIDGTGSVTTTVNTGPGTIAGSIGILTVKGSGSHMAAGDLNVGDTGSAVLAATGTLNIQDASTVTLGAAGGLYLGSAFFAGTLANGTVNQTGGTLTHNNPTDGTFVVGGRNFGGGTGTYNLSAGTASSSGKVYVGGAGTGTLNISAIGTFTASAGLLLGNNSNGSTTSAGTVNLNGGTLNAASVSNGAGSGTFNFNGGLLQATAASATFMTGLTAANVQSGGAMINDGGFAVTIGQNLLNGGGGGGLTKTGSGTLTLTGTNTYSGNTTVSGGTLQISNAYLADAANVSITVGAGMKLDFAGSDTVNALTLDGTPKSPGTYGGTGSGATNIDSHFTGTGTLTVTTGSSGSAYGTWAGTFGAGFNATNNGATQDPDNDGIANALEFVLGGNPLTSSTSILPTESLDATNFYFTFNRADASEAEITLKFQYGSTLTGWTDVVIGAASAGQVTVTENGTAPDTVLVTIPRTSAVGGVLFGRLNAVK